MDRRPIAWQDAWRHRFYLAKPGWKDGTTEFWGVCMEALPPGGKLLEIGPGPKGPTSHFLAGRGELHGVDIDPAVLSNPYLRSAAVIEEDRYPFPDASFDGCVSDFVLEHLSDPLRHFREVQRVLKPGGSYVLRTPNRWHYVSLAARVTPHWIHEALANRLRRLPSDAHEPYPTFHRANSRRALGQLAEAAGLRVRVLRNIEKEPSYGMSSRALFLLFLAYERLVNSHEALAGLRANVLGVFTKPEALGDRS